MHSSGVLLNLSDKLRFCLLQVRPREAKNVGRLSSKNYYQFTLEKRNICIQGGFIDQVACALGCSMENLTLLSSKGSNPEIIISLGFVLGSLANLIFLHVW